MLKLKKHIDLFGLISSGLCAVHCLALPVLISLGFLGTIGSSMSHLISEVLVVVASTILVALSIYKGLKAHESATPYWFFAFGLVTIIVGLFYGYHLLMAAGGISLAVGHLLNHKLLQGKSVAG
jgi:hypothetical protein